MEPFVKVFPVEAEKTADFGHSPEIASFAEGKPQTITTTQTVKDLVVGSGLNFDELGTRELRGIPGKWGLYSIET